MSTEGEQEAGVQLDCLFQAIWNVRARMNQIERYPCSVNGCDSKQTVHAGGVSYCEKHLRNAYKGMSDTELVRVSVYTYSRRRAEAILREAIRLQKEKIEKTEKISDQLRK